MTQTAICGRLSRRRMDRYSNPVTHGWSMPSVAIRQWIARNEFLTAPYTSRKIQPWKKAQADLPEPWWAGAPGWTELYHWTCQQAFAHWREAGNRTALASSFLDTMFNENTFLWDSCFMTMFTRYLHPHLPGIHTLDNFYACQHPTGFICREISGKTGCDYWQEFDPNATGPNVLSWAEWEHFQSFGDRARLRKVFPALLAYHLWYQRARRWPDGTYWATGWSSGMDNQTRVPDSRYHHRFYSWCDTTSQMALDARILAQMAKELGEKTAARQLIREQTELKILINRQLWDNRRGFYFDRSPEGKLSPVMSIGAYWALLAGVVPPARLARFVGHLANPREFKRHHPVPSQPFGSDGYNPKNGGYWRGGVWSPTNYMVFTGLGRHGYGDLAHQLARQHLQAVYNTWQTTGTLWENYGPEADGPGRARPDFVGWTGLSPINIFIEQVLGIQVRAQDGAIDWSLRLTEPHGIRRLPIGTAGTADLEFDGQRLTVQSTTAFQLNVIRARQRQVVPIPAGHEIIVTG